MAVPALAGVESAKVFAGPEGMKLTLLRLSGDPALLIYVQGSESRYEGKVLPFTAEEEGGRTRYWTEVDGRPRAPFHVVNTRGTRSYVFYMDSGEELSLRYDEKATEALKPGEILERYERQKKDGSLARFAAFDRPAAITRAQAGVAEKLDATKEKCGGHAFPLEIGWASLPDDFLKRYSVAGYCGIPHDVLWKLCESPSVREALKANIQSVTCTVGEKQDLTLDKGVLRWTTAVDAPNQEDFARKALYGAFEGGRSPGASPAAPWGEGRTLRELEVLDKTSVCSDGKGYLVVIARGMEAGERLFSGKDGALVPAPEPRFGLSAESFFDPRFPNPTHNPNFRGLDMRLYSSIQVKDRACELRCGNRSLPMKLLPASEARELLVKAKIAEPVEGYGPHALLRDDRGVYYYVDKGSREDNARSFRVFIGNKGKLEKQKLTNLVSDSEGELFSTKSGDLRLLLDKEEGNTWIRAKNRVNLRRVPLGENIPFIYNELGVYQGVRLGTPCDDAPL
jgi:hypothetical protein